MSKIKIAIIGAGVSGITCAEALSKNSKIDLCIFEKSRGVGGRTSTRRSGNYSFDLGFQVFPAQLAHKYAHLTALWSNKLAPIPSSNAYCKQLAEKLIVKTNIEIKNLQLSDDLWILHSAKDSFGPFDYVILTAPPQQTHALLPETTPLKKIVETAKMSPCFTFMAACKTFIQLPWMYLEPTQSVFQWVSHQSTLPERRFDKSLFVAHTTPAWSKHNLETPMDQLETSLAKEFAALTQIAEENFETLDVHRWRYALTEQPVGISHLIDEKSKLAVCGDWLLGHTFLDAQASALSLANELQDTLSGTARRI